MSRLLLKLGVLVSTLCTLTVALALTVGARLDKPPVLAYSTPNVVIHDLQRNLMIDRGFISEIPVNVNWSPDGSSWLISNGESLEFLSLLNGQQFTLLERHEPNNYFAWSPNSEYVAYEINLYSNWYVGAIRLSSTPTRISFSNNEPYDRLWGWTPNSRQVAFLSERDGNSEIYLADVETGDLLNLTNSPAFDAFPAFSPDGSQVAFVSERDGNREIYLAAMDGANPENLTNHPARDGEPAWSPDGRLLAFQSQRDDTLGDIFIADIETGVLHNLTRTEDLGEYNPIWSPDGRWIAYTMFNNRTSPNVHVISVNGGEIIDISPDANYGETDPRWSPDGQYIAVSATDSSGSHIHVFDMQRRELLMLTDHPETNESEPAWQP